jgi:rhodanese-related sulfurtransferase
MADPHAEPFSHVTPQEAAQLVERGARFIDVREPSEYAEAHARGTILVPLNTIFTDPSLVPDDGDIVFICKVGSRSMMAAEMAAASGRAAGRLYSVDGGTDAWLESGLPKG